MRLARGPAALCGLTGGQGCAVAQKCEDGPSVVVIEVDPYEMSIGTKNSFWDIAPPEVSKDPKVRDLRRAYEAQRDEIQRYYL